MRVSKVLRLDGIAVAVPLDEVKYEEVPKNKDVERGREVSNATSRGRGKGHKDSKCSE